MLQMRICSERFFIRNSIIIPKDTMKTTTSQLTKTQIRLIRLTSRGSICYTESSDLVSKLPALRQAAIFANYIFQQWMDGYFRFGVRSGSDKTSISQCRRLHPAENQILTLQMSVLGEFRLGTIRKKKEMKKLSGGAYSNVHNDEFPRRSSGSEHGTTRSRRSRALRTGTQNNWMSVFRFF